MRSKPDDCFKKSENFANALFEDVLSFIAFTQGASALLYNDRYFLIKIAIG